jgi:zinc protease
MVLPMLHAQKINNDRIVEVKSANDPTISFRILFNAGAQYDPAGKEGLAFVTAQLVSDGATKALSYNQIQEKLFPLAAGYGINVSREIAVYTGRVHKDNLAAYYELFIQQIQQPAFNEDDFNRIKADAINYISKSLKYSSDEELGKAALYDFIYHGTAYAHPVQGTEAGLKSITIEDVKAFYTKYYNRNNFVLGIGGGYEQSLVEKLWSALESLPDGSVPQAPAIKAAPFKGKNLLLVDKGATSSAISIGFPISLLRGSKDWYALAIANSWFGEHRNSSSHLYQVIREVRGMNYGDYSYIEHYPNGGNLSMPPVNVPRREHLFEIWIRPVPNENAHFALRAALRELKSLVDNGLTQEQFGITRGFLKKYILHYAPTTSARLGYALDDKFYGLKQSHLMQYAKALESLTLADVNSAIKKYLQYDSMKIAIITGNGDTLLQQLVTDAPSPIQYTSPKSQSVLDEDKIISVFPLAIPKENAKVIGLEQLF